jgi:hypothetical protein
MRSTDIIGSINRIYDRFAIPPNLRMHMYRVAAVSEMICDNWRGPRISRDDVVAACLLHDLGNIVKMDFNTEFGLRMLGKEGAKNVEHWRRVKERMVAKYGSNSWDATMKMVLELGVSDRVHFLLEKENGLMENDDYEIKVEDWELRISVYGDERVGPFGILSLKGRFDDFEVRYKDYLKSAHDIQLPKVFERASMIEKLLFSNATITPEQINDSSVAPYVQRHLKGD